MAAIQNTIEVPFKTRVLLPSGFLSNVWTKFFQTLFDRINSLGVEKSFDLVNNQSGAADITGMRFDYRAVSAVYVDYLVQRVTTGGGAIEKIEAGILVLAYEPTSDSWALTTIGTPGPDDAGITFSITATGQVQYTTTNETGTASISKLYYRARTIAGKNQLYSAVGAR